MTIDAQLTKDIVSKVVRGEDYRIEIVKGINIEFLQFVVDFFKRVVNAKLNATNITVDWYKEAFLSTRLSPDDIAINAGLNKKTIANMYGSAKKEVIIDAANEHFDTLYNSIQALVDGQEGIDIVLTIKFNGVSVDLNVSESLIVINTLAVKRAALRGGFWSTAGKQTEKYLMQTLCKLYQVPEDNYDAGHFVKDKKLAVDREIDFYLVQGERKYRCEVKLMGKGNPESADAIFARQSDLFVADTLSQQNKNQCEELGVCWVACRDKDGFKRFGKALEKFGIPHTDYKVNLDADLPRILAELQ